jgi:phage terminase small subunit
MAKTEEDNLNEKQRLFCKLFVSKEFFGSGVEAYAEAYRLDLGNQKEYNTAKSNAYKLLTNAYVLIRINEELEDAGLNDNFVDKQLLFAITQNADLSSKVKAISEYNKLKQRIVAKTENKNENINRIINIESIPSDAKISSNEKDITLD